MGRIVYNIEKGMIANSLYTDEKYKVKLKDDDTIYNLTIDLDDNAPDPRVEWDNLTHMICWSRHYSLGDEHNYEQPQDLLDDLKKKYGDDVLIKPIYIYDHSGITISTSSYHDPWDSWQCGYVYIDKATAIREIGKCTEENWTEKAAQCIEDEMADYRAYVEGCVYGYTLTKTIIQQDKCPHCGEVIREYEKEEDVDSCCGFYGDDMVKNGLIDNLGYVEYIEEV